MPHYDYLCQVLNQEFEEFHSIMTKLEDCPLCREAGREPHAPKRLISGGSGKGIVEKSFQEIKESFPGEVAKFKRELYNSEKKLANLVGEGRFHGNELTRNKK